MTPLAGNLNRIVNILFAVACIVVIIVGSLQLWDRWQRRTPTEQITQQTIERVDRTMSIGDATVRSVGTPRIVLIEFSDYQCPFCGQYARGPYSQIQRDFVDSGLVAYAFSNLPIEKIHPSAFSASEAAECAGLQNRFWEMHDALFREQRAMRRSDFLRHAGALELKMPAFTDCLAGKMVSRVRAQMTIAREAGVASTPTFFIGRLESPNTIRAMYRMLGAQPYSAFADALQEAIDGKVK